MLKKILVPTDYSAGSQVAYEAALSIAGRFGAAVQLAHVWSAPYFGPEYTEIPGNDPERSLFTLIREKAEEEMGAFRARVPVPPGVQVSSRVLSGEPVRTLLAFGKSERPDLVVASTHGRTGAAYLLLGSVVARLVQHAECPVLAVGSAERLGRALTTDFRKIVVAVDFSEGSRRALEQAEVWARTFDATLRVLHVISPPPYLPLDLALWGDFEAVHRERIEAELEELVAPLKASLSGVTTRVETGMPEEVIGVAAENADLLVLGTHGRTGLAHLVLGSVAERTLRVCRRPVLTVPLGSYS